MSEQQQTAIPKITLTAAPVIEHDLLRVGRMIDERLAALNIANQVATEDTVKAMKDLRAELNKEFKEFEEQRKVVKELVMKPYNDMDAIYKEEITEKYKYATEMLKLKLDEFESKIKQDKKTEVETYFNELCTAENIDFLKFSDTKLEINLSTTVKKYKEQTLEFVERVKSDLQLIEVQQHTAEIMVEYKKDLNASRAIKSVIDRKDAERRQAEQLKLQEQERRQRSLMYDCNMIHREFVKAWVNALDETIAVSDETIHTATKDEWENRLSEIKAQLELQKAAIKARTENAPAAPLQTPTEVRPEPKTELKTEQAQKEEEKFTAKFSVTGTIAQLTALNEYLKQNGLTYQNL